MAGHRRCWPGWHRGYIGWCGRGRSFTFVLRSNSMREVESIQVVISDYPAPVVLSNIQQNASKAIPSRLASKYSIEGHEWGVLDSPFAASQAHHFTRILAADCYWMPGQHLNLVRSMLHFLSLVEESEVFCIAGFHTGRAKLAGFFDTAVEKGLEVAEIYEEDAEGRRREWRAERDGGREDHTERKKWLVIARLKRRYRDAN